MLEQNNQISELEDIMARNNLFEKFSLSKLGVFGSTARGEVSNDIDILIEDNIDYRSLSVLRDDLMYLLNILECIEKIILYSVNCSDAEAFYENNEQMNFNATLNT